jgi:hypothetical protein
MRILSPLPLLIAAALISLSGSASAQVPAKIDEHWLAKCQAEGTAALAKYAALVPYLDETEEISYDSPKPGELSTITSRGVRLGETALLEERRRYLGVAKQPELTVACDNEDYIFNLANATPSSAFTLTRYARGSRKLAVWKTVGCVHGEAFYTLKLAIEALAPSNRANLLSVRFDQETALLVIEYVRVLPKDRISIRTFIDPDKGWIIRRDQAENTYAFSTLEFSYGKVVEGLTFPTGKTSMRTPKTSGDDKPSRAVTRVLDLKRTTMSAEDFRLAAFGLPEPADVAPRQKPTPWYLWLVAAAGVCGALGFAFDYLRRRRKRARTADTA